jgi:hypothetical protein
MIDKINDEEKKRREERKKYIFLIKNAFLMRLCPRLFFN